MLSRIYGATARSGIATERSEEPITQMTAVTTAQMIMIENGLISCSSPSLSTLLHCLSTTPSSAFIAPKLGYEADFFLEKPLSPGTVPVYDCVSLRASLRRERDSRPGTVHQSTNPSYLDYLPTTPAAEHVARDRGQAIPN